MSFRLLDETEPTGDLVIELSELGQGVSFVGKSKRPAGGGVNDFVERKAQTIGNRSVQIRNLDAFGILISVSSTTYRHLIGHLRNFIDRGRFAQF